jgi:hypothetical protein
VKRFAVAVAVLGLTAHAASAQTQSDTNPKKDVPPIGAWAGLTLGPGAASNRTGTRIGAQLGGYLSVGQWVAGYRRGGASGIESGGAYDDAFLVGARVTGMYSTAFIAVGPAKVYDESTGQGRIGIGFTAEAGGNLRVVGLGLSLFGAASPHLSYIGIGLTADAGWIR